MAQPEARTSAQIHPGRGLGWITLGASLHCILTRFKAQPQIYPILDLSYSASDPVLQPIVLNLPSNGIRLRFDGPDQRLRLIELLDFSKGNFTYKNIDLVRRNRTSSEGSGDQPVPVSVQGPPFRHVYNRLFGPSYAGEYVPPDRRSGGSTGTYVLSYPGVAFSFPLKDKSWSDKADFVSLLSSSAASPAISMAIYQGSSWPDARDSLFTSIPALPRSLALSARNKETVPDEIEEVRILGAGRLELLRRSSPPMKITLNETTPQDLVAELGPPDAIYRKSDSRISIHAAGTGSSARQSSLSPMMRPSSTDTDQSSTHSYTEDSESDTRQPPADTETGNNVDCFYNYFHHGFDVLVSSPTTTSPAFPGSEPPSPTPTSPPSTLVVTKLLLHANIPGSYAFNRHRRSRWSLHTSSPDRDLQTLTSEMGFPELSSKLKTIWAGQYRDREEEKSMQRGMVLNRGWGESPESSVELLGGFEDAAEGQAKSRGAGSSGGGGGGGDEGSESMAGLSNTELFGFPGLLFEVLKNDAVSCLTVY